MIPSTFAADSPTSVTRLASNTTLWRIVAQKRDATPPFNALPPFEIRALSEPMALDLIAHYRPDLEVLSIERRPS